MNQYKLENAISNENLSEFDSDKIDCDEEESEIDSDKEECDEEKSKFE